MGDKRARKLLQKAKDSATGWTGNELKELYKAFGFTIVAGAKHDLAKHPKLPDGVKATITRSSGDIHPDYIRTAVDLIERVQKATEAKDG